MRFEILPCAFPDGQYWDVWDMDTGLRLAYCASAGMAVYAIVRVLNADNDARDAAEDTAE